MYYKYSLKQLLPLIILFIISACGQKEDPKTILVKEFPQEISIEGEQIDFDSLPLCPQEIMVKDSLLIKKRVGRLCDDYLFYVYNINTKEFLGAFGTEGRGPSEFLYPLTTGQFVTNNNSISLWVHDGHQHRLHLVNINESIKAGSPLFDESITGFDEVSDCFNVVVLPEGNLVGRSIIAEGPLFLYDKKNNSIKWVEYFPKVEQWPPDHALVNLYNGAGRNKA